MVAVLRLVRLLHRNTLFTIPILSVYLLILLISYHSVDVLFISDDQRGAVWSKFAAQLALSSDQTEVLPPSCTTVLTLSIDSVFTQRVVHKNVRSFAPKGLFDIVVPVPVA